MDYIFSTPDAIANIQGDNRTPNLSGEVRFYQKDDCVLVMAKIEGLPPQRSGFYGFHIHEGDNCTGENFAGTGNHYNPSNQPHPDHAGDLPPLLLCNGGAYMTVKTDRFTVSDVIGRTVVIHDSPDDFTSQPAGNAGMKIACGVIYQI
ncbi:MAG: superoxide dismutase family protein [Ruminococcaceae bacterium]|nr:superoxide dismutase family protein [Oscillospiraceae bacterium]